MNWDILDQDIENYRKEIQSVPSDFYVYILLDPTTPSFLKKGWALNHEPFYVGKGTGRRYRDKKNRFVQHKIKHLKSINENPICVLVPCVNETHAYQFEEQLIDTFGRKKENSGPLLNIRPGGLIDPPSSKKAFVHPFKGKTWKEDPRIARTPSPFKGMTKHDLSWLADRSAKTTEQRSKFWKITFSDGSSIEIKNLKKFAAENNFNYQQLKYHGNLNKMSSFGIKVEKLSP